MKKSRFNLVQIITILLALVASIAWTISSIHRSTITLSYIVDAVILILLVIVILGRNRNKTMIDHENHMDWITEGSVENYNKTIVTITSLEKLIDLAVELDDKIIHDTKLAKYFLPAKNVTYIYQPDLVNPILDNKQQLGKLLIDRGSIRQEQLETGLFYQRRIGCRLGEALIALGFIDETVLYSTLAAQHNIAYYELDPNKEITDTSWISKLGLHKAQTLQVLPLGYRKDNLLVVACGETAKTGISIALAEMLETEVYVVAACPSYIFQVLEKLENNEKSKRKYSEHKWDRRVEAYERISSKEWEQFMTTYHKGRIDAFLFLKASGFVDASAISQAPDNETIINWLIGKNLYNPQIINLFKTLDKLVKKQDYTSKQEKIVPDLLDLLESAYYITEEAADWIFNESEEQDIPIDQLLVSNYLVAAETVEYALIMIATLKSIISKPKIF